MKARIKDMNSEEYYERVKQYQERRDEIEEQLMKMRIIREAIRNGEIVIKEETKDE